MVPPPRFDSVRFETYFPDPNQPSQTEAVEVLGGFAAGSAGRTPGERRRGWFGRQRAEARRPPGSTSTAVTASARPTCSPPSGTRPRPPALKAFGTFVELTNLVGALGFQRPSQTLSGHRLLCIDEFELDDPGDTVLVSTLLGKLVDAGVALAATSNTLPGKLGEGRFASADFLREIQGLSAHFRALRIDGEDYRHRGLPEAPPPYSEQVTRAAYATDGRVLDDFPTCSATSRECTPAATAPCTTGCGRLPHRRTAGPTSRRRCGSSCSPTGCTTARSRCSPPGCPSTRCSARRC